MGWLRTVTGNKSLPFTIRHSRVFSTCCVRVMYMIFLSCGRVYTGGTGQCSNDGVRELANFLRGAPSGYLAVHCKRCESEPVRSNLFIVGRFTDRVVREVLAAFFISSFR